VTGLDRTGSESFRMAGREGQSCKGVGHFPMAFRGAALKHASAHSSDRRRQFHADDLAVCASLVFARSTDLGGRTASPVCLQKLCGLLRNHGASWGMWPRPMCPESEPFLPKTVRRRAVMISLWKGSNPFSCSTFSANRLNLRGLCFFGRLAQGVEQVLVEAAAWAGSIGETANAPTRGMDLTEFA